MNKLVINLIFIIILAVISSSDFVYKTKYLDVPVDHFNFNDDKTFKLRFLINDSYWNNKFGPIFFYTGNEGNVEMFAQNTGFMWETAKKFKALVVFAEHRFYGESLPFGNISLTDRKYFGYLSAEQTLLDFVDVIYYIKSGKWYETSYNGYLKKFLVNPVIVFGGSYGGMLSAWFRMKYPAVVEGALASSAPIWQFTGMTSCSKFYRIVTSVYNSTSNKACAAIIKKSWKYITDILSNETGKEWFSKNWKLCSKIENEQDTRRIKNWVQAIYENVAMTNYPYSTNFLIPLPANPVNRRLSLKPALCHYTQHPWSILALCSKMVDSDDPKELLQSIFHAISIYFNGTGNAKCLDWNNEASKGLGVDGWNIQSCTQMVMPMCTNGIDDIFEPNPWDFKAVSDDCYEKYKVRPVANNIEKQYGGKDINTASNILFSNGLLDPWYSGGVLKNVSSTAIAIILPDAAHHLDLRATNENDPVSVINARRFYRITFRKWIYNYYKRHGLTHIPYHIDDY